MVKSKVDPDVQLAEFLAHKHELFIGDKVKPCTDKIFSVLSKTLGITSRAVYLSIVRKTTIKLKSFSQTNIPFRLRKVKHAHRMKNPIRISLINPSKVLIVRLKA